MLVPKPQNKNKPPQFRMPMDGRKNIYQPKAPQYMATGYYDEQ